MVAIRWYPVGGRVVTYMVPAAVCVLSASGWRWWPSISGPLVNEWSPKTYRQQYVNCRHGGHPLVIFRRRTIGRIAISSSSMCIVGEEVAMVAILWYLVGGRVEVPGCSICFVGEWAAMVVIFGWPFGGRVVT